MKIIAMFGCFLGGFAFLGGIGGVQLASTAIPAINVFVVIMGIIAVISSLKYFEII